MKEQLAIDFVVAWVDGNDPEWQRRRNQKQQKRNDSDFRPERYRDWDLLRYWFRGVEKNTPWVRKIHLICDQDPPGWLNRNHPQLHIVYHEDYIPADYLPTFNSHTIELNSHRIPGLSEQFVYFCDDMFLIRPMKSTAFFKKGLPRDCAGLNPIPCSDLTPESNDKRIFYIPLNDAEYLNREFRFRDCLLAHPWKWYNPVYGGYFFRNIVFSSYNRFIGFSVFHLAQPYTKKAFTEAWEKNEDILKETCSHAFRNDHDVSQSFVRYRQLAQGKFIPQKPVMHGAFHISDENSEIINTIKSQKLPMICLNDGDVSSGKFDAVKEEIQKAFEYILPDRSGFEKDDA